MTLLDKLDGLSPDERRVVERIVDRLLMGQRQYGPLTLATDKRNWLAEAAEELLDAVVYLAARVCQ